MSSRFERLEARTVFEGPVFAVQEGRFRHEDGDEVTRQWVEHPGSVGIVAHDGEDVWLVRQPREAVGVPDLLELPAGKLDEEGESPLECARRELAEEIGKAAGGWEHLTTYYASVGFTDEQVHVYLATDLHDDPGHEVTRGRRPRLTGDEASGRGRIAGERISIERRPLAELDALIAEVEDAKTVIGLLLLRDRLATRPAATG
jgi:ADP-ribose pyrophosphatase